MSFPKLYDYDIDASSDSQAAVVSNVLYVALPWLIVQTTPWDPTYWYLACSSIVLAVGSVGFHCTKPSANGSDKSGFYEYLSAVGTTLVAVGLSVALVDERPEYVISLGFSALFIQHLFEKVYRDNDDYAFYTKILHGVYAVAFIVGLGVTGGKQSWPLLGPALGFLVLVAVPLRYVGAKESMAGFHVFTALAVSLAWRSIHTDAV